jgi:alpha-glucosidase
VEAQKADAASPLHLCHTAVTLRHQMHTQGVLSTDDAVDVDINANGRLVVRRDAAIVLVLAMGNTPIRLPSGRLLITSGPLAPDGRLPPDTTAWLRC